MKPTLFILAPSDIAEQNSTMSTRVGDGVTRVDAEVTGVLPILPFVMNDPDLKVRSASMLLGLHKIELAHNPSVNLFNLVGDADSSPKMLHVIQGLVDKVEPNRCFNPPGEVFKTSRETLPRTLAGIAGCLVPRVERVDPANFTELQSMTADFGCWPVIIRARGYHGGKRMLLVKDAAQLEAEREADWLYEGIHLIEFVDFRGADGLYQKIRVMMIDGKPYARHAVYSDRWAIHGGSRRDLMEEDARLQAREERFLADLRDTGFNRYAGVLDQIYQRIGLDVFGIDFALVDDQMVVFEANACMQFLVQKRAGDRYGYLEPFTRDLEAAVKTMLQQA